ncbi:cysteine hydrolase [Rugosimonospora acidiphila]|uniref:Cysteine hydrolase n=1 Tax=Rugosimonospora acidiphila TaxID=556531 RepID=A0ABP9RNK7_9ACTN
MCRALLVLDMINDVVATEGAFAPAGFPEQVARRDVLPHTAAAVAAARQAGDLVVWVAVGFRPGYLDWPAGSPLFAGLPATGGLARGGWGTRIHSALEVRPEEPVIVKSRVSPFHGTELEQLLRTAGVEEVLLAGVSTDHVVLAAARDAHDRDFTVRVLADCCGSSTAELHEAAVSIMASIAEVTTASAAYSMAQAG